QAFPFLPCDRQCRPGHLSVRRGNLEKLREDGAAARQASLCLAECVVLPWHPSFRCRSADGAQDPTRKPFSTADGLRPRISLSQTTGPVLENHSPCRYVDRSKQLPR